MIISLSQVGRLRSTVPDKLSKVGGQFLSVPHRPTVHTLHPVLLVPLHVLYKIQLARLCSLRMPVRFMEGEPIWNTGRIDDTQGGARRCDCK